MINIEREISNGMKKILLISYFFPPEIGGIQNYLYHLCQGLDAEKIVVLANLPGGIPQGDNCARGEIISRGEKDKESEFDKKQNFKIYRESFFSAKLIRPSWFFLFFKIFKIVKKEKIEIIQFGHYHQFCLIGLFFKVFFNLPYLIYFHGIDLFIIKKNRIKILLFKLIVLKAKFLIANSQFIKEELIKYGIKKEKIEVITPAVDYQKFDLSKKQEEIIKKYNLENKRVILSIGRLTRIKGFDLVIKAIPEILKEIPNLVYLIVGDNLKDNYKIELENLISKFNLKDKVIFLGEVEDRENLKSEYYNLAEIVVIPSREINFKKYSHKESFGIVSLEAQTMAKPVIISKIGGLGETIADQETGIFVSVDNEKEIVSAIVKLLKNRDLAYKMGQMARKRIEEFFDWPKRIEKIKKLSS